MRSTGVVIVAFLLGAGLALGVGFLLLSEGIIDPPREADAAEDNADGSGGRGTVRPLDRLGAGSEPVEGRTDRANAPPPAAPAAEQGEGVSDDPAAAAAAPPAPAAGPTEDDLARELKALRTEREALRAEVEQLRAQIAAGPEVPGRPQEVYRFGLKEQTPFFDQTDWGELSRTIGSMQPVLREILHAFRATGQVPGNLSIEAQKYNMPLAQFAIGVAKDVEGAGPNGSFTHPAVVANFIRVTLEQLGDPLTPAQDAALRRAGEEWIAREAARTAGYDEQTLALARMTDEVASKQRFLDDAQALLSPAQRERLFDPEVTGRGSVDLFSPALVFAMRVPVTGGSHGELEKNLVSELAEAVGMTLDGEEYAWLGNEWLAGLPEALERKTLADHRVDIAFPPLATLLKAARAQVAAMERLIEVGQIVNEKHRAALRELTFLFVPQVIAPDAGERDR